MSAQIVTKLGTITIDNEVIARTAGLAAMDTFGIVGMAAQNVKDGFVQLLKRESLTRGINVTLVENHVSIDLHIIVEYGINITAVAETLISTIKYKIEDCMGLSVDKINIHVEGVRV